MIDNFWVSINHLRPGVHQMQPLNYHKNHMFKSFYSRDVGTWPLWGSYWCFCIHKVTKLSIALPEWSWLHLHCEAAGGSHNQSQVGVLQYRMVSTVFLWLCQGNRSIDRMCYCQSRIPTIPNKEVQNAYSPMHLGRCHVMCLTRQHSPFPLNKRSQTSSSANQRWLRLSSQCVKNWELSLSSIMVPWLHVCDCEFHNHNICCPCQIEFIKRWYN